MARQEHGGMASGLRGFRVPLKVPTRVPLRAAGLYKGFWGLGLGSIMGLCKLISAFVGLLVSIRIGVKLPSPMIL